eukprot:scaffold51365_cov58-Phaeocystis_antarctica.AAC.1
MGRCTGAAAPDGEVVGGVAPARQLHALLQLPLSREGLLRISRACSKAGDPVSPSHSPTCTRTSPLKAARHSAAMGDCGGGARARADLRRRVAEQQRVAAPAAVAQRRGCAPPHLYMKQRRRVRVRDEGRGRGRVGVGVHHHRISLIYQ